MEYKGVLFNIFSSPAYSNFYDNYINLIYILLYIT